MDRLEAMSTLIEVVDSGGFSAAARSLGVPVATVSRRISDLESRLGARLLIRTTRRLSLTDAGLAYLAAARRIIEEVDEAERQAAGEFVTPKGELVISAPVQLGQLHVLPVVIDFLARFPEIHIRLLLLDRNVQLVEDPVDMVVRIGRLPDSTLIATNVGSMRTVICASPQLLAAHGTPETPAELARLPCVVFESPATAPAWQLRDPMTGGLLEVDGVPRLSVTTAEAAVRAAIAQVGVVRLFHYQAADAVRTGALQLILEDYEPDPVPVSLVHAGHGQMPLKMRRFLDFAAPRLRSLLGQPPDRSTARHRSRPAASRPPDPANG